MGDLAGKPTRFPEKIINGLFRYGMEWRRLMEVAYLGEYKVTGIDTEGPCVVLKLSPAYETIESNNS